MLTSPQGFWSPQDYCHLKAMATYLMAMATSRPWSPQSHGHFLRTMVTSGPVSYLRAMTTPGLLVILKRSTVFLWSPQGHSHHRPTPKSIYGSEKRWPCSPWQCVLGDSHMATLSFGMTPENRSTSRTAIMQARDGQAKTTRLCPAAPTITLLPALTWGLLPKVL